MAESKLRNLSTDDDVELVTVDELLLMMETNIPHENAKPDR